MTRVLILEDEPGYRQELEHLLEQEGYQVRSAGTARTAVEEAIRRVPDVLVADWLLKSSLNGLDVAQALRLLSPSLRTILITGFSSQDLRADAELSQLSAFLEKPFSGDHLRGAVRRASEEPPRASRPSPVAIVCLDRHDTVTHANAPALELLGGAGEEVNDRLARLLDAARQEKEKKWVQVSPATGARWRLCRRRLSSGESVIAFLDEPNRSFAGSPHLRILLDLHASTSRHWPLADHVLVVDPDEWERRRARTLLRRSGCVVHTAEDASTAVRLFERDARIDIVVFDASLPTTGQRELAQTLQQIRPRVALIPAEGSERTEEIADEEATLRLHKPWNVAALVRLMFSAPTSPQGQTEG